jgi:hypothetical protein
MRRIKMNVQRLFDALNEDQQNSALGIICHELEDQGYRVSVNGKPVISEGFFSGEYSEIEKHLGPLNVSLMRNDLLEQEFVLEFIDFHQIKIGQKEVGVAE